MAEMNGVRRLILAPPASAPKAPRCRRESAYSSSRTLNCETSCACTLGGTASWCDSATV